MPYREITMEEKISGNYENLELYVTSKQGHHIYTLTHKLRDKFPLPLKKIQRSTYAVKLDVLIEL